MAAKSTTSDTPETTEAVASAAQVAATEKPTIAEDADMSNTPVPAAFQITLQEFMQKLSARDNRVELINAFYYTERQAGHIKDFEANFQARFVAFTQLVIED
jgi:Mrp family chromosome partitioning ATPase